MSNLLGFERFPSGRGNMLRKYVSSKMFTTPMGVARWVRLQLKSIEKLSHETAPPVR